MIMRRFLLFPFYFQLSAFRFFLFALCLLSCASSYHDLQPVQGNASCLKKFRPVFHADWYNASVDVIGKHLSGLLLFKMMPDSSTRVVFTNEVGVTFFDFEFG